MNITRNPGRTAGLLYIVASIPAVFALLYVPSKIIVHGDAAATVRNIASFESLYRFGIAADLIGQALFVFVALALYQLLRGVDQRLALQMLTLLLVAIPIAFLNEVNSVAALLLARGGGFLAPLDAPQRDALAMFFLNLRSYGFDVAGVFWGLWLFPLGLLVYRSGFMPRVLGVLLMIACFAYLANSFTSLLLPIYASAVARWMNPVTSVEFVFMVWLAIVGAAPVPITPRHARPS
ncbi:MAG: DUF4386 domain-containing protein [Gemmatimonadaceae bacterium]